MAEFEFSKSSKNSSGSYIIGKIIYSIGSTNTSSNTTSSVTATLYVKKGNDSMTLNTQTSGTWSYTISINGLSSGTKTIAANVLTSWVSLGSYTINNIAHNNNGTKTIAISGSVTAPSSTSYAGLTSSGSKNVNLTTIPRASSITSAGAVTLSDNGAACSVKWTPLASSFAYKLTFTCGAVSETTGYITPNKTSEYTYTNYLMKISKWAAAMPKTYSATCTVTLDTYTSSSSNTSIGSSSKTFTLTLPNTVKPTIAFTTASGINTWTAGDGKTYYLQGISQYKLAATFTAGAGSYISSCSISGNGISYSKTGSTSTTTINSGDQTSSVITKTGNQTYTAKVIDGRTNVESTKTITVYAYSKPSLSFSAARATTSGSVTVTYSASCSSVNSQNKLKTLTIYKKSSTESAYTVAKTITLSSASANSSVTLTGFEADSSYNFKATVSDTYGKTSNEATVYVTSEFRILNIKANKKGIAFGQLATDDGVFACNLISRFTQPIRFGEDLQCNLYKDINDAGSHIVYILTGQNTSAGAAAGLAIHNASLYVPHDANSGIVNLGSSGRKWNQLYAANATISTSDKKVKTNISNMSDTQEQLFNKLKPVTFEFTNGSSGRTHYGFISQDVENSLNELKLTGQDFAGFCKDLKVDDNGNAVLDEDGQKVYDYSLRYSEFIALNTYMIQKLQAENKELKTELQVLKEMIMDGNTSSNSMG